MLLRIAARALIAGALAALVVLIATIPGFAHREAIVPVAVIVATIAGAAVWIVTVLRRSIRAGVTEAAASEARLADRRAAGSVERLGQDMVRDLGWWLPQAAATSAAFADLGYPLPLGGGYPLGWDAAGVLAREIALQRPDTILELGSGGSSLLIAASLRRIGHGHLHTLDHEREYAEVTRRHVDALGLQDWVTVHDAPLADVEAGGATYAWYDLPAGVRALASIDLVVVDGPPQTVDPRGTPRYPAMPVLAPRLSERAVVFVDDASRDAEQRMLERWQAEQPGWRLETFHTMAGTAVLRRSPNEDGSTTGPRP